VNFGYVVRPRADQDLDEISDYLAEGAGVDLGLQFLSEVYATFSLLASNREIGWHCHVADRRLAGVRTFRVSERFEKYLIFYQACDDRIEVLRVLYGSRDLAELFRREGVE
jgi:plasmid stabilization system protein ParE